MVDWKEFSEKENYKVGTHSQDVYDGTVDELIKEGTLSLEPKNNFSISTPGICLTPRAHGLIILYFTKEEDAKKYAEINYSNAMYPVFVERNT